MARAKRSGDSWTRSLIALVIVGSSLVVILVISGVAIALADNRSTMSRLAFTSVLPLLGTWVGTVLAFYFARENLEAATDSTLALAGRADTPVTKVMIREADIMAHDLAANEDPKTVKLSAVRATMADMEPPGRRVPIRDANRVVLYVIHDSTLTAFAEDMPAEAVFEEKTIGDLLADAKYRQLIEANGYISENATISEARTVMTSKTATTSSSRPPASATSAPSAGLPTPYLLGSSDVTVRRTPRRSMTVSRGSFLSATKCGTRQHGGRVQRPTKPSARRSISSGDIALGSARNYSTLLTTPVT